MNKLKNTAKPSGFTLIELLIVIAILGVLAVVVLVAINPVQQLARTRDSGRKSAITQLGRALQAYYTARNGTYVTENATWLDSLVTSGELASAPSAISYASGNAGCSGAAEQNNLCYDYDTTLGRVIVYARMESNVEASKCATGTVAYFVYSSRQGRGGLVCSASAPTAATDGTTGGWTWNSVQ